VQPQAPLSTLLSWGWVAHTIEVDNAVEAAGSEHLGRRFRISLPMWTNALRVIDEGGITVAELGARARAGCNIGGLERWGWIAVGEVGGRRREGFGTHRGVKADTVVRPTRAGAYARRLWPRVLGRVEQHWRARFGAGVIDDLRHVLLRQSSPMPWSPPEVHPSDGFYTHTVDGGDAAEDPDRPLVALLGQTLTALTCEREKDAEASLPLAANLLRVIGSDVVRTRDLPAQSGVSKAAIAMAVGYLQRHRLAGPAAGPGPAVRLTPAGLDALDGYRYQAEREGNTALRDALEAVLVQRQALSAGLAAPIGCWRGERPYSRQTQRLQADPTGALPWQPMVLHRGGWPDGS
jgi:hypothetical protein